MKKIIGLLIGLAIGNVLTVGNNEKLIMVVVPSFNNAQWYKRNLDSIFSQKYSNFKVIYIDDCSDDGTGYLVQEYLAQNEYQDRCELILNQQRFGPLYNRYKAIHSCPDEAIIVLVDGDDWLAHDEVFSYLNEIYTQEDIYMTVGNACKSSTGKKIGYRDYTEDELAFQGVRQLGFRGVHPRTFYAWLFKKIKLQDLFDGEKLYPMATDVACLLPMFEMAQNHYKYIMDILYVYNDQNPINMARTGFQTQLYCDMMIRNRSPYSQLSAQDIPVNNIQQLEMEGIMFMMNDHERSPLIEDSLQQNMKWNKWVVINRPQCITHFFDQYKIPVDFSGVGCDLHMVYSLRINIKDYIKKEVKRFRSPYVLIMADELLENTIDFNRICNALEKTGAHSMIIGDTPSGSVDGYYTYYHDEKNTVVIARPWMISQSLNSSTSCKGILVKREALLALLDSMTVFYPHFSTFLAAWHSVIPMESVILMNFLK